MLFLLFFFLFFFSVLKEISCLRSSSKVIWYQFPGKGRNGGKISLSFSSSSSSQSGQWTFFLDTLMFQLEIVNISFWLMIFRWYFSTSFITRNANDARNMRMKSNENCNLSMFTSFGVLNCDFSENYDSTNQFPWLIISMLYSSRIFNSDLFENYIFFI